MKLAKIELEGGVYIPLGTLILVNFNLDFISTQQASPCLVRRHTMDRSDIRLGDGWIDRKMDILFLIDRYFLVFESAIQKPVA